MIPKVFHRIWLDEQVPAAFEAYWERLQTLHPDWEFRTWDRSGDLEWMQNRTLFDRFTQRPASYAFRSDIARYEILNRFGGVYIDTDVEPLRAFDELLGPEPFIAWCSPRELDPAVMGSPPHHPAIEMLVNQLDQVATWVRKGRPSSPPGTTGPAYVTARWRGRDDVRRLPAVTFFPYHWSRMEDGNLPWPARSFAVHHWNAGWKRDRTRNGAVGDGVAVDVRRHATALKLTAPTLSVLVAFRDADGHRTATWDLIRALLAEDLPEVEVVVGTDDGDDPFHKTRAINRAAREATGEVLGIWDADTWVPPDGVRMALRRIASHPTRWVRPWYRKQKLNERQTEEVLRQGASWNRAVPSVREFGRLQGTNTYWAAPPLMLTREAFEAVGGMDERFRGWGGEDEAFGTALTKLVGGGGMVPGNAIHLWHPSMPGRLWVGQGDALPNRHVLEMYRKARTPEQMRQVVELEGART